jgi:hypothetical protein
MSYASEVDPAGSGEEVRIVCALGVAGGVVPGGASTLLTSPQAFKARAASIERKTVHTLFRWNGWWCIRQPGSRIQNVLVKRYARIHPQNILVAIGHHMCRSCLISACLV